MSHKKKLRSPDCDLDPRQFPSLNKRFYEGFPGDFIFARLGMLCRTYESSEVVKTELTQGTGWGLFRMAFDPEEKDYAAVVRRTAELELVALRQQAAETLFRVFWVHLNREPCTWLALARLRQPGDLQTAAKAYLAGKSSLTHDPWADDDDRRRDHARVIWGASSVMEDGTLREERLGPSADAVALWVAQAAHAVCRAPLYNAYKHGLAVVASEPFSLTFGATPESPDPLTIEGERGFAYLERVPDDVNQRYVWHRTHESIDFELVAAEIAAYGNLLIPIVTVGAFERGVAGPRAVVVPNAAATPEALWAMKAKPDISALGFSESLIYLDHEESVSGPGLPWEP